MAAMATCAGPWPVAAKPKLEAHAATAFRARLRTRRHQSWSRTVTPRTAWLARRAARRGMQHRRTLRAATAARWSQPARSIGTDYCDLTGEVPWIAAEHRAAPGRRPKPAAHASCTAADFDSIPSDLGTWFAQRELLRAARRVRRGACAAAWAKPAGRASGGTVASLLGVLEEASRGRRRCDAGCGTSTCSIPQENSRGPQVTRPDYGQPTTRASSSWTAPFVMASDQRTCGAPQQRAARFSLGARLQLRREHAVLQAARQALAISAGMGAGDADREHCDSGDGPVARWLPKPGEGPDRDAREAWFFRVVLPRRAPR
jgi:short subunit dehydrogenase-like uncharacterized protein